MNKREYLLVKLAEECGEVIQAVSKILIFGAEDEYKGHTNRERLAAEINDLIAVATMLDEELPMPEFGDTKALTNKIDKVEIYMNYSREVGTLI